MVRHHTGIYVDFLAISRFPIVTNWHAQGEAKWVTVLPMYFMRDMRAQNDNDWWPGIA